MFSLSNSKDFCLSNNLDFLSKRSWDCLRSNSASILLRETDEELEVLLLDCELLELTLLLDERTLLDDKDSANGRFREM